MKTKTEVQALVAKGDRAFRSALDVIKERQKHSPIILFGAGEGGLRMKTLFDREGIGVSFFADNAPSKWGGVGADIPILSPNEAASVPHASFVISASNAEDISTQLRGMGVRFVESKLYLMYSTLAQRPVFLGHIDSLQRVRALLHDVRSLETFDTFFAQTVTLDPSLLRSICDRNQYFPEDRFALHAGETMVDAGAFTGDTVADVVRRFGREFKSIHCFEPNNANFSALRDFVTKEHLTESVVLHNQGLSDCRDAVYFSGSGLGYHMTGEEDPSRETISTTTIDNAFAEIRVDFIKMDIEGAEPLALRGAEMVIRRDRPKLAICIYHAPEHFWEIPLMLAKMVPEYTFLMRHHSLHRYETVWYAARKT